MFVQFCVVQLEWIIKRYFLFEPSRLFFIPSFFFSVLNIPGPLLVWQACIPLADMCRNGAGLARCQRHLVWCMRPASPEGAYREHVHVCVLHNGTPRVPIFIQWFIVLHSMTTAKHGITSLRLIFAELNEEINSVFEKRSE